MRFLEQIANAPESGAVALEDGAERITYAELTSAVNQFAVRLQLAGVSSGTRVGLVADNSAAYLAAALAVWRLGAVLVTVYPSSTVEELRYVVENSQATVVLADTKAADKLQNADVTVDLVISNTDLFTPGHRDVSQLPALESLDDGALALICYTSGSTARPKAVMHSSAGLVAGAAEYARVWRITAADKTVVCLPMAWVFGLTTASMSTLLRGGTVIVLARTNPQLLVEALTEHGGTFLPGVTTTFVKLTEYIESLTTRLDVDSLRLCISGGEPRNETVFNRWQMLTGVPVHDVFAASECFPVVTYDPIVDPEPRLGSAGRVVPGAQMRVVNEAGDDVPVGQPGEALWKAPAHFLGYWDNEEATAAATVDGWYRTKDQVLLDSEGYVFVLGRLSDMIIRGGANVSPAEVEAVLAEHPAVRASAVFGRPDPDYGEQVVAAVVPQPGVVLVTEDVVAHCRERLAAFKIPTTVIAVEELAVNDRTGKVDRKAVARALESTGVGS